MGPGNLIARDSITYRYGYRIPCGRNSNIALPTTALHTEVEKGKQTHHPTVKGATKSYGEDPVKFAKSTTLVVTVERQPSPPEARLLAKIRSVFVYQELPAQNMRLGQLA